LLWWMLTSFEHKEATNWSSVFLVGFFQLTCFFLHQALYVFSYWLLSERYIFVAFQIECMYIIMMLTHYLHTTLSWNNLQQVRSYSQTIGRSNNLNISWSNKLRLWSNKLRLWEHENHQKDLNRISNIK
jgi:hypothetical protein